MSTNKWIIEKALEFVQNSKLDFKPQLKELIKDYSSGKYSFHSFEARRKTLEELEFFLKLKSQEMQPITTSKGMEILFKKKERQQFLRKFASMFSIIVLLLTMFAEHPEYITDDRVPVLNNFYDNISDLADGFDTSQIENTPFMEIEHTWIYLISLHNKYIEFIREIFPTYFKRGEYD